MEIIHRYVYAVVKQLPEAERKEVEKELIGLIGEMMEQYDEKIEPEEAARQVIETLGDPTLLANQYRGRDRYLIGPKYFNQYVLVLKIVMMAMLIGITVSSCIEFWINQDEITTMMTNYISNLIYTCAQGAMWVTVVFAIFEYNQVNLNKAEGWSLTDLPEIPHKKALISRGESIFAIVFTTVFFSLLYFAPQLFSIYFKSGAVSETISVFNLDVISQFKGLIMLICIVTVFQESLKILWGRWSGNRALINAFMSIFSAGLSIIFFADSSIWNTALVEAIQQYMEVDMNWFSKGIVGIIIFATLLEIATTVYKGFRYGDKKMLFK